MPTNSLREELETLQSVCASPTSFHDPVVVAQVQHFFEFWCSLTDIQRGLLADVQDAFATSLEHCLLVLFIHTPNLQYSEKMNFDFLYECLMGMSYEMVPTLQTVSNHIANILETRSLFFSRMRSSAALEVHEAEAPSGMRPFLRAPSFLVGGSSFYRGVASETGAETEGTTPKTVTVKDAHERSFGPS